MLESRREFAKTLAAGTALLVKGSGCRSHLSSEKDPLIGIQPSRYFDLAHRADLAIHAMTNLLDKQQDYLPYFDVHFHAQPPVAVHNRWDYGDCIGRYIDALRLARIMSGQTQGQQIEAALQKLSEGLLGEHGLSWWPDPPYTPRLRLDAPRRVAEMTWTQRGALLGLTTQYAITGEQHFRDLAERLIDGLNKVALWRDGMAYFPVDATKVGSRADILYPPEGWSTDRMPTAGWFGGFVGALIWPLARFATLTGYEPALRMAKGVAEYCLRGARLFRLDGRFQDLIKGHFHSRITTALGLLRLGLLIGNEAYVQMAERIYTYAKEWGTPFGWFPEDISSLDGCETCCITDMIELGIGLALWVDPRYWNDAERFGRNHLLESQLLRPDLVDPYPFAKPYAAPSEDPLRISRDNIAARARGCFAGWSGFNTWGGRRPQMMACCNGAGTRALYDLWHYGVSQAGNNLSVNLLFSRATEDVVIKSYLPFEGRVDIQCRSDRRIRLRVPDYVPAESLSLEMNSQRSQAGKSQDWLQLPPSRKGDVAVVRFELPRRDQSVHMGYDTYEVQYQGDTVTAMSPPTKVCPLYERQWVLSPPPEMPDPTPPRASEIDSI